MVLTAAMMVIEIVAGWWFNSMAVFADGLHMSTDAAALGVTAFAYAYARRSRRDPRYAFGPWKVEVLGGFASAIVLALVALFMAIESVRRLSHPLPIHYVDALAVAVVGLVVNLVSALMLKGGNAGHTHTVHSHHHPDLNLRAAYVHMLTDTLTSVLAIVALLGGVLFGWRFLDPVMGLVGSVLVGVWAVGLLRDTSRVLLDREMDHPVVQEIREAIESDGDTRITDLHVWRVGRSKFACIIMVTAEQPKTPHEYRARLSQHEEIVHTTIEVER